MKLLINNLNNIKKDILEKNKKIKQLKEFKFKELYEKVVSDNKNDYYVDKKEIRNKFLNEIKKYINE